jgi:4-hydroxythreonine-4-phosphate dehydrogenase
MKVYVSQGHELGIGLEVFFKSCLLLRNSDLNQIKLIAFESAVIKTLKTMNLPFKILDNHIDLSGIKIEVEWVSLASRSQSFASLEVAMKHSENSGVLFTLPTSKDQFPGFAGHTEYFRAFYERPDLGMFFSAPKLQILLLSDHIALKDISSTLTEEVIYSRLITSIKSLEKWDWPVKRILISGMNPHAGENGLIGLEDKRVSNVIKRLSKKTKINMIGPLSGDTMLLEKTSPDDLLVYLFHDQGLGVFKGLQGYIGSNITLGLPYPRLSPDHGTSFSLFGKNKSDYRGCEFSLKEALNMLKKVTHGKNSSNQGKST